MKLQPPTARDRQATLSHWLREATQLHQANRFAEADVYYSAILKAQPTHLDAKLRFGLLRFQEGRYNEALKLFRQAVAASPGLAAAHTNLANVYAKLGRREEALASYDTAISLAPDWQAINNRGVVRLELGRAEDALADFDAAHALRPDFQDAILNRGHALKITQQYPEALEAYAAALRINPRLVGALNNSGQILLALLRPAEAIDYFERALAVAPDDRQALNSLGIAFTDLKRLEEAVAAYDRLLALSPDFAEAVNNRGVALRDLKRPAEALMDFQRAVALKPGFVEAQNNLGLTLRDLDRIEEELAAYDVVLRLNPDHVDAHIDRGIALNQLGRPADALASFERGLALRPGDVKALFSRSLVTLLTGDLAAGWPGYALRFVQKEPVTRRLFADCPHWTGEGLIGRRFIVSEEQGLGDIIQFSRYLLLLADAGADVTFLVSQKLHRLLAPLGEKGITLADLATGPFDLQSSLLSLPQAFGTTLETIPARIPYLAPEPALVAAWRDRLGESGFKIGIAWQGNPASSIDNGRSVPLAEFEPLGRVPGVRLISLQKTHGLDQLDNLPDGMCVETLGEDVDADLFVDTAAIMASLDLVVTSDTAIAHLAGSLGRPTWVALRNVPDWRWLRDRGDSPWYPTMRLFRQPSRGNWKSLFEQMATELQTLAPGQA